jgi:hypothetical protein
MAVDPLGLVYSGADGTGAAFKAPWTSYDPYQAEMMKGQTKLKMLEEKKKAEQKQKEDAFKSTVASPVKWDPYVDMPNRITTKASNYLTNLYATGQSDKVQSAANQIASFSKSTANVINSLADSENKLRARAYVEKGVLRDELEDNLRILRDPSIAPPDVYPDVAEILEKNRAKAKEVQKINPWMDDEEAEYYAKLNTSAELATRFMDLPREYPYEQWMPKMMAESKGIMDKNQQAVLSGSTRTLTKDVTRAQAEDIIERNFKGSNMFADQMRREFKKLDDDKREEFGNALTYAKQTYYEPLTGDVELKSRSGGISVNVNTGQSPPVSQEYKGIAREMPAGKVSKEGVAPTSLQFPEGAFAYGSPGQQGNLDNINIRSYVPLDETVDVGTLKIKDSVTPVDFRYQNGVYLPIVKKDFTIKDKEGNVIRTVRAGSIPTKETFDIIKNNNYTVPNGYLDWQPFAEGAITYKSGTADVSQTVFAKWEDVAPTYASYVNYRGKDPVFDLAGKKPKENIYDYYGINKPSAKASPTTTTTTTTTTTAASTEQKLGTPKVTEIKRADIPAKAKAAYQTEADYEAMLKKNGIKIIE